MVRPPPAPCVCLLPLLCCAIVILAYLSYVKEFRGEFSGVLREEQAVVEEVTGSIKCQLELIYPRYC